MKIENRIKTETKYDIGNIVYRVTLDSLNDKLFWFVKEVKIERIILTAYLSQEKAENPINISYAYESEWYCFTEKELFATKEEAQKECDRRNNGSK